MAKSVNASDLFSRCMAESVDERLTATTVATYITSPFTIHCNKFAPADEKDEITEYQKLLFQRGNEHETQIVSDNYPDMATIPFATPEDGFRLAIESMVSGTDALHGMPIYYLPDGLYGVADILEKSNTHSSIFGNYHYTIKEIKLAKNIQEKHLLQGAFYNYLLGQIQGITPKTFAMINRDGEETLHEYSDHEQSLFDSIEGTRNIIKGDFISPTHGSCGYPWESYCNKMAVETNDISLVAGIAQKTKNRFVENGFKTVKDLAGADTETLTEIKGVGKITATKYVNTATAIQTETHIIINKDSIIFPERRVEIFLDLEGIDPTNADEEIPLIDYLIGILVRTNSKENYVSFIAADTSQEKEMLLEFLDYIKKQRDYVIYHYHHYEKTHLTKMMEKHEIDEETQKMVLDHLIDIHKIATNSVVFPTYGNGLKQIARYMGFSWRHKDVSATESISMYLDYIKDPEENTTRFQKVIDYNEDDCIATRVIKDWLVSIR
ncbi:MAG: TM0106 family RecB-like putative nuclease [Thaumarchaeota archaeon]|nr:TM0106 family RecB-like putative nuclease [Nitrososphaerota archaeon]